MTGTGGVGSGARDTCDAVGDHAVSPIFDNFAKGFGQLRVICIFCILRAVVAASEGGPNMHAKLVVKVRRDYEADHRVEMELGVVEHPQHERLHSVKADHSEVIAENLAKAQGCGL